MPVPPLGPSENPFQLTLNEVGFQEDGYVELVSNAIAKGLLQNTNGSPDIASSALIGKTLASHKLVVATKETKTKQQRDRHKAKIKAIIDLDKFKFTKDQYMLITTKSIPDLASSQTNTIKRTINTYFGTNYDENNLLDMKESTKSYMIFFKFIPHSYILNQELSKPFHSVLQYLVIFIL